MKNTTNEIELQEKCKRVVQNEVLTCISGLAEKCFEKEIFSYEDFENLYEFKCPNCGEGFQSIGDFGQETENRCEFHCPACNSHFDTEPEQETQEVFEYWLVSEWLYSKLKAEGEPVYNYQDFNHVWGRTTTGQVIYADYVIEKIVKDLHKEVTK